MENIKKQFCPPGTVPYTILPGDTLYIIARKFNIDMSAIAAANPLVNPYFLHIGQTICIPQTAKPDICPVGTILYIAGNGDTTASVARMHKITVDALLKSNAGIKSGVLAEGQRLCIPMVWNNYSNSIYKVTFKYPSTWKKVNGDRYQSPNGFFQISAISSGNTVNMVCMNEAYHTLRPYGSQPIIVPARIQGQPACYIFPSSDQPLEMEKQAALIVLYPKPVVISGLIYNYFALWASTDYIQQIASALSFMKE